MVKKFISFLSENVDNNSTRGSSNRVMNFKNFNEKDLKVIQSYFPDVKDKSELSNIYKSYQIFKNEESDFLRKEPKYIPLFFYIHTKENVSISTLEDLYKDLQSHKNTIKQNNIDVLDSNSYEDIIDKLDIVRLIEKTNKFVKLLPSKLRGAIKNNPINFEKFSDMIIDYSYNDYKNTFLKKVSKYENPNDFFGALENHLSSFRDVSDIYKSVEDNPNASVYYSSDDFLIAMIFSSDASCDLGSQQWCISNNRMGNMWNSYISKKGGYGSSGKERPGVQYFIWDFRYPPSNVKSLIGVTYYNNDTILSHNKSDADYTSVSPNQPWFKYLRKFDDLRLEDKVKYVVNNPDMETYTHIISSLDDKKKRSLLSDSPRLLLFFDDLSFLTKDEIWSLVSKDPSMGSEKTIIKELSDDQLFKLLIKRPSLSKLTFRDMENPYKKLIPRLSSNDKIKIITNDYSFYETFVNGMTQDELLKAIELDPNIMIETSNDIANKVDSLKLKNLYLANKDKWDRMIESSNKVNNADKLDILLSHLSKSEERLEKENNSLLFIYGGYVNNGRLDILDGLLPVTTDVLTIPEDFINELLIDISIEDEFIGMYSLVPKDLVDENLFKNRGGRYIKLTSSMDELNDGNGSEDEQKIFDFIKDNSEPLE